MEGVGEDVKLYGYWGSPFVLRVVWSLKIKGINYEYVEEDLLHKKSPLLLEYNPVYKKVPVLVHKGKPVSESLVIMEYIEEMWKHEPLLPSDPYERARARFWAKYVDDKCFPTAMKVFSSIGEEKEKAVVEARGVFKTLEGGLEGRKFFGGEKIAFADVAAGWLGLWIKITEEVAGAELISDHQVPLLNKWFDDFLQTPVINECLPDYDKLIELNTRFRNMLIGNASA